MTKEEYGKNYRATHKKERAAYLIANKSRINSIRRKHYYEDRERFKNHLKKYYRKHTGRATAYRLKKYYGITLTQYNEMFEKQNGVCAICGKPETATNQYGLVKLAVDHNHLTGAVRGLLCGKCNKALGGFCVDESNTQLLQNAIAYVGKNDQHIRSI